MITRQIVMLVLLIASIGNSYAQNPVEIKGVLSSPLSKQVTLYSVVEGTLEEVTKFNVKEDGAFRFMFYPEYEGFYVLGTGNATAPSHNNTFYFKGGDRLDVNMTDTAYVLQGKLNSEENQVMSKWFEQSFKVKQKSNEWTRHYLGSTFVDFFPDLEKLSKGSSEFIAQHKSGNTKFDKVFPILVKWDIASFGLSYLFTGRSVHPRPDQYPEALNNVSAANFTKNTEGAFLYPYGSRTINLLANLETLKNKTSTNAGILDQKLAFILSDGLKGDLVLSQLSMIKDRGNFDELIDKYGQYIITPRQKKMLTTYESQLRPFTRGENAFDFSFPDVNDKLYKLSELKGKVVVIDVWATWCGPCKQEIPHLEKLSEHFKGKDVVFVSISTDKPNDKAKWLKMIKDESMGGIQLFAGGNGNTFSKHYMINTIPRFLVFDKNGKLVSADAPKPSDPKLKLILEEELNRRS